MKKYLTTKFSDYFVSKSARLFAGLREGVNVHDICYGPFKTTNINYHYAMLVFKKFKEQGLLTVELGPTRKYGWQHTGHVVRFTEKGKKLQKEVQGIITLLKDV
jgi:predicted transcriptional regulator